MNKQFIITTYDAEKKETFQNKFWVDFRPDQDYLEVLEQMTKELREYHFEINLDDIYFFISKGQNPKESYIKIERGI